MFKLTTILIIAAAFTACVVYGLPAFSVVMACLEVLLAGLTAMIIGTLALTNLCKINYETAATRSFWGGAFLSTAIVVGWTTVLNLMAGSLTADLVPHLWQVSLNCVVATGALAALTFVTWGGLVFTRRKAKR